MASRRERIAVAAVVVAAVLAAVGPASASALTVTKLTATPSSTQAGGHPDFTISMGFSPDTEQLKALTIHLPPGLVGNPNAATQCSEAAFRASRCAASSTVGSTAVHVVARPPLLGGLLPVSTTATGTIYDLAPHAGEPARLGIDLKPLTLPGLGTIGEQYLESPVSLRQSDFGLDSVLQDIPRTLTVAGPVTLSLYITGIDLTLNGQAAKGPFVMLPTSCGPATTRIDASSYQGGAAAGSTSFTPTGCDRLPFSPKVSGSVGGAGQTAKGGHPAVTVAVTQAAGQAAAQSVSVTLPSQIGADIARLNVACPADQAQANQCPPSARVGTATAVTPLLSSPLTGPVLLVSPPGGGLPGLRVDLGGQLSLSLPGDIALSSTGRIVSTFATVPDLPLSRFELALSGGDAGTLLNTADLCGSNPTATGAFVAHSGAHATDSAVLGVTGCGGSGGGGAGSSGGAGHGAGGQSLSHANARRARHYAVRAKLVGHRHALRVTMRVRGHAKRITRAKVTLPRHHGMHLRRSHRRRLKVITGGRRLAVGHGVRVHRRTVAIRRLPHRGARGVRVKAGRRVLRVGRRARHGHPRLTVVLHVRGGARVRMHPKLR